jgi:hypothetical protein
MLLLCTEPIISKTTALFIHINHFLHKENGHYTQTTLNDITMGPTYSQTYLSKVFRYQLGLLS